MLLGLAPPGVDVGQIYTILRDNIKPLEKGIFINLHGAGGYEEVLLISTILVHVADMVEANAGAGHLLCQFQVGSVRSKYMSTHIRDEASRQMHFWVPLLRLYERQVPPDGVRARPLDRGHLSPPANQVERGRAHSHASTQS